MSPEQAVEFSTAAARKQGCVCDVEVVFVGWAGSMPQTTVSHDDWCPLLRVFEERTAGGIAPGSVASQVVVVRDADRR